MNLRFLVSIAVILAFGLALTVLAQGGRTSTWEPNTSLTFNQYFEPFPRVDSAEACRDSCVRDVRCTGWTYYHTNFQSTTAQGNQLRRACIIGAGLKDRRSGNAAGRTAGQITK